jgi:anti-sigma factor RsiW
MTMSDKTERFLKREHGWAGENLSAYLDDMLSPKERARVERHLQECEECRDELEGLRYTIMLCKSVPEVPLPRSFLVPLSEAKPQKAAQRGWAFPALRVASAMATFLFVIVLSGNLLFHLGYLGGGRQAAPMAAQSELAATETSAPPVMGVQAVRSANEQPGQVESVRSVPSLAQTNAAEAAPEATPASPDQVVETVVVQGAPQETPVEAPAIAPKVSAAKEPATPTPTPPLVGFGGGSEPTTQEAAPTPEAQVAAIAAPNDASQAEAAPTVVAAEQPMVRGVQAAPIVERTQVVDTRQRIGMALQNVMWALLLATVVLWAATALMTKRRR